MKSLHTFLFVQPDCKRCNGEGYIPSGALLPHTCERCRGQGVSTSTGRKVALWVLAVLLTVGPVLPWLL
jgi:DnaJ-class molecular chaperone